MTERLHSLTHSLTLYKQENLQVWVLKSVTFADLPLYQLLTHYQFIMFEITFGTHTDFWYGVRVYTLKSIL